MLIEPGTCPAAKSSHGSNVEGDITCLWILALSALAEMAARSGKSPAPGSCAIDGGVFQEVIGTRGQVRRHLADELVAVFDLQRIVREPLGADGGRALGAHVAAA